MADGKVVISTGLDNRGIEKDSGRLNSAVSGAVKGVKGTLGGLTKVVAGVTASIAAAFGSAAVAITKHAVDAYADYEQLFGGVETLFKDSADMVVANAEKAFYTVGISANEYMETVTSFSASLISSLAGDTAEAAKAADMALTDMADNANKMGTPLESIKNAYQGFAKQNYTMLDNLKLGYGGTKTEMERLLADAQKLTGVKYDINNLADVYNAIHAIQEEMGIAGATAAEAERTITGSANMTKAAWNNVLAAIAGGGDLDRAINNLVFSLSKFFDNIVPVVERSLAGIGRLIEEIAPALVETVATALIKALPSLLNAVYQMIVGLANGIYEGIAALLSGATSEVAAQIGATDGLADGYNDAADGAENLADATDKAGKAAKRSLAGFDEITKLGGNDDSASGDAASGFASGVIPEEKAAAETVAGPLVGVLRAVWKKVLEIMAPILAIDFQPAIQSVKRLGGAFIDLGSGVLDALEWAWFEILAPLAEWTIEDAAPAAVDTLSAALKILAKAIGPVTDGVEELWDYLDPFISFVEDTIIVWLRSWEDTFEKIADTIGDKGEKIKNIFSGIGEIFSRLWALMEPILSAMRAKWQGTFEAIGSYISDELGFIIDELSGLVDFIAGVLTLDWERAWDGLVEMVKAPLNSLIGFINTMISAVVSGVNAVVGMVNKLSFDVPEWVPEIGGSTFGFNLNEVTAPQIPYLAQGAVLPPNKPFLAVVGDQKHGTNVEAPLATIQEAVAIVMGDMIASNMAGHEATVGVLREILEAVLGIEVGDDVIGRAAARYNGRIAVMRGGS